MTDDNGWLDIATFAGEPHGQGPSVLIAAGDVVGEAWYHDAAGEADSHNEGWWWAGTHPGEYYDSPVSETNDPVTHWRPLPPPPSSASEGRGM